MNVNDAFPSKYVRGAELPPQGVKVTIDRVTPEKLRKPGAGEVDGWLLWCDGAKRGIVLTAALARQIAGILRDPETDNWTGKAMTLYPEPMRVAGVDRVAIRARANGSGK